MTEAAVKFALLAPLLLAPAAHAESLPKLPEGVFAERDIVHAETDDGSLTSDVNWPHQ